VELHRRHLILGAAALLAAAGGGVAIAASQSNSPSQESQAVIDDAAAQLGIPSGKLSDALKKALADRIDAAVAAGRLTKTEGDELKQRIQSGDFPLFGVGFHHGFGHFGPFHGLDGAASYLGLTEAQLRAELETGKTLAQITADHGKSADGLVDALVAAAKKKLDDAVAAGHMTKAQADELLSGLKERITNLVNGRLPGHHPSLGFRHFDGAFF
jgi:hypothetical protein